MRQVISVSEVIESKLLYSFCAAPDWSPGPAIPHGSLMVMVIQGLTASSGRILRVEAPMRGILSALSRKVAVVWGPSARLATTTPADQPQQILDLCKVLWFRLNLNLLRWSILDFHYLSTIGLHQR